MMYLFPLFRIEREALKDGSMKIIMEPVRFFDKGEGRWFPVEITAATATAAWRMVREHYNPNDLALGDGIPLQSSKNHGKLPF